ncbi:MAG: hypothetical protein GQ566_02485 [Methanosarcinales archaeon]|nr:hypothetical protein [Methanosarcinales archaeon]
MGGWGRGMCGEVDSDITLHRHLAYNLRKVESDSVEQAAFESQLAEMATDPEIQAELQEIDREFAVTEADGLKS